MPRNNPTPRYRKDPRSHTHVAHVAAFYTAMSERALDKGRVRRAMSCEFRAAQAFEAAGAWHGEEAMRQLRGY